MVACTRQNQLVCRWNTHTINIIYAHSYGQDFPRGMPCIYTALIQPGYKYKYNQIKHTKSNQAYQALC